MIKVTAVSKSFGQTNAVNQVSFEANDREILVLLGPSGCGKTTMLKMINRLIEPDTGSIAINGQDIGKQKPEDLRRKIGFVMQHSGLFPHYTIAQNIAVVPKLLGWEKQKTINRTAELIEKLHLPQNLLSRYPHELSGGQQQRVGIARALMANTPVLLMDEPFGALDNITKADIHAEFKSLEELKNKTIILVTHDVQEAFELGHRICLMDRGEIVQIETPKEMLYRPINNTVKNFFASNRLLLEYKIATMADVSPFLQSTVQEKMSANTNIWQALQLLGTQNSHLENYSELTNAFNAYRKTQLP